MALLAVMVSTASAQPKFKILHAFSGSDGAGLWGNLIVDQKGNLYGTTGGGGPYKYGTVFELSPGSGGEWTHTILHGFDIHGDGGYAPLGGLVFDAQGNLYGGAEEGGAHDAGTIFELTPGSSGWTYTVIYTFCSKSKCQDGGAPYGALAIDKAGILYGTAGGAFELTSGSDGWTEEVLYGFRSNRGGTTALAGPILDEAGNLYGTTEKGGTTCPPPGCGTTYELKPVGEGWKHIILHNFGSFQYDGEGASVGQLAVDGAGSLYGTTFAGGRNICFTGCGTVFKLTPESNGHWKETILYNFRNGASGNGPGGGVVVDKAGNLYGTTIYGGGQCGCGVVYKLAPAAKGGWKYTVLHTFVGSDGAQPDANLILDSQGNLYGTTPAGGSGGLGVVFEVTP
ncbi:MAG TPA: choice-of-anchor tandem repeat GloVer-containing protein [Terriglobales bacterium]|nr:choice-of-anchor tandem repeat GloVer-containing protein [Terriglobales bacterium]